MLEATAFEILSGTEVAGGAAGRLVSTLMRHDRRGHNLYYPIPYAEHCKITYESPNVYAGPEPEKRKGTENVYYNIECRTYTDPVEVVSYAGSPDEALRTAAENTRKALSAPKSAHGGKQGSVPVKTLLAPGKTAEFPIRGRGPSGKSRFDSRHRTCPAAPVHGHEHPVRRRTDRMDSRRGLFRASATNRCATRHSSPRPTNGAR